MVQNPIPELDGNFYDLEGVQKLCRISSHILLTSVETDDFDLQDAAVMFYDAYATMLIDIDVTVQSGRIAKLRDPQSTPTMYIQATFCVIGQTAYATKWFRVILSGAVEGVGRFSIAASHARRGTGMKVATVASAQADARGISRSPGVKGSRVGVQCSQI
ncbi:hypothetical protein NLI96_g3271 [Meripilus lineatus]|uniref:Uncharacterized protein n=1 Tax=Meripilus lineatus TaxID=2056292 RepID=A0AAD5V764_9APHY|nr:hypothetical protein NLI96_g3271 [Physisporinus lineatus]